MFFRKILALIFCAVLLAVPGNRAQAENDLSGEKLGYILISSKDMAYVDEMLRNSIQKLCPGAKETYLECDSPEAKKYIDELGIKFVPFVIYDKSIVSADNFFSMVKNNMIEKKKGYYVIPDEQLKMAEVMVLGRQRMPNKLCIYAMSFCPYAQSAQATLFDVIKKNNLDVKVDIKYIVDYNEFGISSLHGPEEIKEDLRQILINKYYPDRVLDYLMLLPKKGPEGALAELGLSADEIYKNKEEALAILKEQSEEIKSLGISQSPMFLWENIYLIPNVEILKRREPFSVAIKE